VKINEVFPPLGKSVRYNFFDIFSLVRVKENGRLKISLNRARPAEVKKSGIYVWHHPDWGYFYVGIAAADNFTERWNKHIQKLLDNCSSAKQMANWKTFATRFREAGYGIDDLKDITLRFYPVASRTEFPGEEAEFKKYLETIETRIVAMINPACNKEHDPDRPSATRYPDPKSAPENLDTSEN
jgi:hypothetical protein